jgi:2-polyprenyl-3-methyl-5-hydroxy-6-metoxy-1,4-benzoquinol methylase
MLNEIALSPERLYLKEPYDLKNESVRKHIARYRFASSFVSGKILDCACGSGYGSNILAINGSVIGIDISQEAIDYARENNSQHGARYKVLDISNLEPLEKFNSIVCLETFEHIDFENSIQLLKKFDKMLEPLGTLVISTPMLRYKDGKPYVTNPYHINEMPKDALLYLFLTEFRAYTRYYFHQNISTFTPLQKENTGFLIMVARKP